MKKTFILSTIILSLMTIFGCGNKTETIETSIVVEETIAETATEESEEKIEDVITNIEENENINKSEIVNNLNDPLADGVFTEEEAMYKVERLIMAYEELIKSNKNVEWNILDRCERFGDIGNINIKTKDDKELNTIEGDFTGSYGSICVAINYFYDYVNNNGGYYDFTEYIQNHTLDEIFYKYTSKEYTKKIIYEDDTDSNDILFLEAIGCIPYIREFKLNNQPIEVANFVEGEECSIESVNETEVFYELTLSLNGENSGLFATFDKNGNMLNINSDNAYDKFEYIFTFEGSEELIEQQ